MRPFVSDAMHPERALQLDRRPFNGLKWRGFREALFSIRGRLMLLVAAVFLPLSALVTVLAFNYANAQRGTLEAKGHDTAVALVRKCDGVLTRLTATLSGLASSPSLGQSGGEFERHAAAVAEGAGLRFVELSDPQGHVLFTAPETQAVRLPPPEVVASLGTRALAGAPAVSDVITAQDGGDLYFIVVVPVVREGRVAALLSAASGLDRFAPVINGLDLEDGWNAAIIDGRGTIVARNAAEKLAGTPAVPEVREIALGAKPLGTAEGMSREGVLVSRTVARMTGGWIASVSVPVHTLEAPLRRTILMLGLVGASFAFFALGLSTLIAKKIAEAVGSVSAAALALLEGKPLPAVSLDVKELTGVAAAFDYATKVVSERRRAEDALRMSEARFRGIFDNAAIGVALVGLDGRWQMVNDRLCEILGYRRDELLAKTFQELTNPEDLPKELVLSSELLTGLIPNYTLEKRYLHKGGRVVWGEIAVSLKRGADGAPRSFILVLSDISERKAAEEAVRAAEERERRRRVELETVLEAIPAAVMISGEGPNAKITANRAAYELLRLPRDLELGQGMASHPAVRGLEIVAQGKVLALDELPLQVAAATAQPVLGAELALRFADGEVKYIYGNALPLMNGGGRVQGAVAAFVDITARKRAETGLRRTETRLRRLQDSNIIGIVTANDAKILEANRIFLDMIGRSEGDLRDGRIDWRSITPAEHALADANALEQLRRLGFCEPYEKEYIRQDGTRVPVLLGAAEVESEPKQYVCFVLDLSERKLAENRIRFLMREVSHRSKNLLAVVQAMTFQTARSAASVEEFQTRLEERLQGLAISHDLLVKRDWQGVPLLQLARRQVLPLAGKGESRLTLEGPPLLLRPEASQSLGFALHELATNAVKYGALSVPGGRVTLAWSLSEGEPRRFRMSWVERGGPPVEGPKRRGFGIAVVERMLATALEGNVSLKFPPEGVCWSIDVPATCLQNGPEVSSTVSG